MKNDNQFFNVPILLIGYKRVATLSQLLNQIKELHVNKLYIALDGPKNLSEKTKTQAVIKLAKSDAWAKQVFFNISSENLGLRKRVVTSLNWVFEHENMAIILEDDLLPETTFYAFCKELLIKYRYTDKISSIAGFTYHNFNQDYQSYYFSKFIESWGWATWKRAWKKYRNDLSEWNKENKHEWLDKIFTYSWAKKSWIRAFDDAANSRVDSWAYRWAYTCMKNNTLTIVPKINLIDYHGLDSVATHTITDIQHPKKQAMHFPLKHPRRRIINSSHNLSAERHQAFYFFLSACISTLKIIKLKLYTKFRL